MSKTQNLKNHARFDPAYHALLLAVYLLNLVYAAFHVYRQPSLSSGWYVVLSLVVIVPLLKLRTYPLKVQDRVIRLEERLRLQALAPQEWHTQLYRLNEDQLIGLRFAADDEVVELSQTGAGAQSEPKADQGTNPDLARGRLAYLSGSCRMR